MENSTLFLIYLESLVDTDSTGLAGNKRKKKNVLFQVNFKTVLGTEDFDMTCDETVR